MITYVYLIKKVTFIKMNIKHEKVGSKNILYRKKTKTKIIFQELTFMFQINSTF